MSNSDFAVPESGVRVGDAGRTEDQEEQEAGPSQGASILEGTAAGAKGIIEHSHVSLVILLIFICTLGHDILWDCLDFCS